MNRFTFLFLFAFSFAQAQTVPACCMKPSSESGMMAFAGDKDFILAHANPEPFVYASQLGKMITYATPDGKTGDGYLIRATKDTHNWLIVCHEWWGLNDYIKQRADELYAEIGNVNVLAIDYYDGKVASVADSASKYIQGLNQTRLQNIIAGAINYTGADSRICTIGWCMGGLVSVKTAMAADKRGIGCVTYYGIPDSTQWDFKSLHADVLGLFASQDKWITPEVVNHFVLAAKSAKKNIEYKSYDADHAFANPSNPHYNVKAADDANKLALAFLIKHFK
jgi:carboxymethylenebutenolidase